jgi:hypothetical protein
MFDNSVLVSHSSLTQTDIPAIIDLCLKAQQDRNLSEKSLLELKRYLNEFSVYCINSDSRSAQDLTPDFLK